MFSWIKNQVFVIMPFSGNGMNEAFRAIEQACSNRGMPALRADEAGGSAIVMRKIVKLILESEFIIADLSYARPNVYFEIGFALGVGNLSSDVLLVARKGSELHFDIAPYHVQLYESTEELESLVEASLQKMKQASPHQLRRWSIQIM